MTISEADYERMSWHARQRLNDNLRREHRELTQRIKELRREVEPLEVKATAVEVLAGLPSDPYAESHRLALHRELEYRLAAVA